MKKRNDNFGRFSFCGVLFVLLCLFVPKGGQAQESQKPVPKIGEISGIVLDGSTDLPVEFATVSLIDHADSLVAAGNITDVNGKFEIKRIPLGVYRVEIYFIGYQKRSRDTVYITADSFQHDFGTIKLNTGSVDLNEVVVTYEQKEVERSFDKKIYNINKNIMNEGGSALEALGNIPSVAVNIDGEVTLRGDEGVMVLVDGKQMSGMQGAGLTAILEQIPSNSIEKIEVVTNPSARYDAEGVSGIINVVLKKKSIAGTSLLVNASTSTWNKYRASANFDYKAGIVNYYAAFSFNHNPYFMRGGSERLTFGDNRLYTQSLDEVRKRDSYFFRTGIDFSLSEKSTLGTSVLYGLIKDNNDGDTRFESFDEMGVLDQISIRNQTKKGDGYNLNTNLSFTQEMKKEGQEYSISANLATNVMDNDINFSEQAYNMDNTPRSEDPALDYNFSGNKDYNLTLKNDFVQPIGGEGKIEVGHKSTLRKLDFKFDFESFDYSDSSWDEDPAKNNDFAYEDWVHAAYIMYANKHKSFGYQIGLRGEQAFITTEQRLTNEINKSNYFKAFPSVYLSYDMSKDRFLEFSYSRGIKRPRDRKVNPLVNYSDPQNLFFGNPNLRPEIADDFELAFEKEWDKFSLTSGIFYQVTNDVIQRVVTLGEDDVSLITYQNIDSRNVYGAQFNTRYKPTNWLKMTFDVLLFQLDIDGANADLGAKKTGRTAMFEFASTFKIPKIAQVQLFTHYQGPLTFNQGVVKKMYSFDLAVKRTFADKKGTISLHISDIFNTKVYSAELNDDAFSYNFDRKRESQIARLSLTYKIGKIKNRKNKVIREPKSDEDYF